MSKRGGRKAEFECPFQQVTELEVNHLLRLCGQKRKHWQWGRKLQNGSKRLQSLKVKEEIGGDAQQLVGSTNFTSLNRLR